MNNKAYASHLPDKTKIYANDVLNGYKLKLVPLLNEKRIIWKRSEFMFTIFDNFRKQFARMDELLIKHEAVYSACCDSSKT